MSSSEFRQTLHCAGQPYTTVSFADLERHRLSRLPWVLRLMLENVLRQTQGTERLAAAHAILAWVDSARSEAEIPFLPNRVLMHDTTSTPALVDIAAMRDVLAQQEIDPTGLTPSLPVDVSVDHSLAVVIYGQADAASRNLAREIEHNRERYAFMRWAAQALPSVRIHPPGTGIMHTINLEQLATVVHADDRGASPWLHPDMLLGTDSHTPMINGIGVLAWGVGGLEAQTVMFGMPTMVRIPEVIGVRLVGQLPANCQATDLALVVTERLRELGVAGEFVEYFGPGVSTLSAGARAVVANMAPEYGATTGYFAIDEHTLEYLRETGRTTAHIERIAAYAKAMGFWFEPTKEPVYTRVVEIDLAQVHPSVAGPRRPQDRHDYRQLLRVLRKHAPIEPKLASGNLPVYPVAIAAITSCTNTSDPRLLIAAALVARKARQWELRPPTWVKTSLAPGSPAALDYLGRAGLLDDLHAVGFDVVGFGCTTCIGNSGELTDPIREALANESVRPVAMLSGNRNFPGRVHPDLDLAFIMSPVLVIGYALTGDAAYPLADQPLVTTDSGQAVYFADLLPTTAEVEALWQACHDPADTRRAFTLASVNPAWEAIPAASGPRYPWQADSTYLQPPPFAQLDDASLLGHYVAQPLLILGDDITTDHISPASAIPRDSFVAEFLLSRGEDPEALNVFASRRGNWQVMMRGAFFARAVHNHLAPSAPTGHTLHVPSGHIAPIHEVANRYADSGTAVVLVAGERYGMGSSRDWAAKAPRLLGVRAVLAMSFERIHRSNLIGMGIVPLRLAVRLSDGPQALQAGDRIELELTPQRLAPRQPVTVVIHRSDGSQERVSAVAAIETELEVEFLRAGGILPMILQRSLTHATNRQN